MKIKKKNLLILEGESFSEDALNLLRKKFNVQINLKQNNLNKISLNVFEYLFVRLSYKIDKKFLKKAKNLQYIISPTTGLNHIDLKAIENKKIKLISLRNEKKLLNSINTTAELTWGLALTLIRKINISYDDVLKNKWERNNFRGYDLKGKYCGIIGYGRIGKKISKYAKSFGMKVIVFDKYIKSRVLSENTSLKNIFKNSFVIFVTASFNDNKNFINSNLFRLTSSSFFINTSRGELVNYDNMIKFVNTKNLIGAAFDVLPDEQNRIKRTNLIKKIKQIKDYKKKFLITPHIGGATISSMKKTELYLTKKLLKNV